MRKNRETHIAYYIVMLLYCDFVERMVLPFVLRVVTPFAEPEKSLNAMDGLTIIVSDLVKQPCDSDYKYMKYLLIINEIIAVM